VTAALAAKGVDAKDVQTQNYSVQPSFTSANNKQVPDGYLVNNTVTVKIHDIKGAGAIIDAATAAGGNDAAVQGVSSPWRTTRRCSPRPARRPTATPRPRPTSSASSAGGGWARPRPSTRR